MIGLDPYFDEVREKEAADNYSETDDIDDSCCLGDAMSSQSLRKLITSPSTISQSPVARINNKEKETRDSIRRFIKKYPHDKETLVDLYLDHKDEVFYYADICAVFGEHFHDLGRVDDADYFYNLDMNYMMNGSKSSQGYMHLALYNREIAETTPISPTASLYFHLEQAVDALSLASSTDEVARLAISDLLKIRNMIFRWHLSVKALQVDWYYGPGNLVKVVYARGFVNRVLQQAKAFRVFRNAKRYDGSMTNTDLAKYLIKLGFYGVFQYDNQHNWVHRNGFMVRVKRIENVQTQFTVGLTFVNPIVWNADGTPHSLKKHAYSGMKLVFDETNEILKLAYDEKAVFVVPAFRAWYWFNTRQVDTMMDKAHFPLKSFGCELTYDTEVVKALLTFKSQ